MRQLEEEKNALLDYIEENIEKSHQHTERSIHEKSTDYEKLRLVE